ncbi:MAG TPA: beta-mannanase [Candidatus Paenibacillus intestinavium]|nr:beta-mannanase [Candidatus Paenibacillus intestinavium]
MTQPKDEKKLGIALIAILCLTLILVIITGQLQPEKVTEVVPSSEDIISEPVDNGKEFAGEETPIEGEVVTSAVDKVELVPEGNTAPILIFEAETGETSGTELTTATSGYSGDGYVTSFTDEDDHLVIPIHIDQEQMYQLTIGYRASGGYKESELYVNDEPFGKVIFEESSVFTEAKVTRLFLTAGDNTITIRRGWGYFDIDYVALQSIDIADLAAAPITEQLSNSNATPEAVQLMEYMNDHVGKYLLSGQQNYTHIIDIENMTGKRPAIVGFDFIEYSPTRAANGSRSSEVESAIAWHKQGGIVSFLWHWNAPTGLINEPGKEWWRGFYSDSVTFNLTDALADKNSEQYQLLLSDMDVIAEKIKILKINDIPILFRPLHEADGGWFWWGASGPEAAVELYRIMYDRFVNVHELNNLIWVWNSVSPSWYPGDDVVDIVSYDSYPVAGDHSAISSYYDKLVELTNGTKYIAMMENGSIPDPDAMMQYGANWGLFITWNGDFLMDGKHNSKDFLNKVYNDPRVITLEDLPWSP